MQTCTYVTYLHVFITHLYEFELLNELSHLMISKIIKSMNLGGCQADLLGRGARDALPGNKEIWNLLVLLR